MIENIVTFETAELAYEKGFRWRSALSEFDTFENKLPPGSGRHCFTPSPTQSLLQKWLREIHGIQIAIDYTYDDELPHGYTENVYRNFEEQFKNLLDDIDESKCYDTYENALECALLKALKMI